MIRFIDLRDQILDAADYPVHFAFYDTVTDVFVKIGADQDWTSRAEFEGSFAEARGYQQELPASWTKERFLNLMPEWVK